MSKTEISYRELMGKVSAQIKKEADASGEKFDVSKVAKAASARWSKIKAGNDPDFVQGKSKPTKRKSKTAKKGKKSKMHDESAKYTHHHHMSAQVILDKVDLCDDCREKIKEFMSSSKSKYCKTTKKGKGKGKGKNRRKARKTRKANAEVEEEE